MTKHSIIIQRAIKNATAPSMTLLRKWARHALQHEASAKELTIRLVNKDEITHFNQTYRKKVGPTNVLSFPAHLPSLDILDICPLGDILICADVVNQEATDQGKSQDAHWAHMVIHGTLHLLGHDHENEQEALIMETLEIDLLNQLGFPNPYDIRD